MALIKCENVSIGYEGQMVVHDLNFEINQGLPLYCWRKWFRKKYTCKESFGTEECG